MSQWHSPTRHVAQVPAAGSDRSRRVRRTTKLTACMAIGALLLAVTACSSNDNKKASKDSRTTTSTSATSGTSSTSSTTPRPAGPTADLTSELTGGDGPYIAVAAPDDLNHVGYEQHEYVAAGKASSYKPSGKLTHDGRWTFVPGEKTSYRTRILVRTPAKAADFSGTVVVEWLNVSAGVDAEPEWSNLQEEIVRAGDAWVGVSAQEIGVNGGPVAVKVEGIPGSEDAGKGLKVIDPKRYGSLHHPGDRFSFDIFTQVGRALRSGRGMHGLRPQRVIAAGQSQSAFAMVTYFNGVQPLTHTFDAFFVHSRGGASLPIIAPGKNADIAASLGGQTTIFRTDDKTPILDIQTETDLTSVLNSYAARQPDSDHFRLWEVAGTAHADLHTVGSSAKYIKCGVEINNGPLHVVAKAAYHALVNWLTTGKAPPKAPRIEVTPGATPQIKRDANGIALGGIRTAPVDVPVAALSGAQGPVGSTICLLLGSTKPLPADRLAQLYPSRAVYTQRFGRAADSTIREGFALAADRKAMLTFADPSALPS